MDKGLAVNFWICLWFCSPFMLSLLFPFHALITVPRSLLMLSICSFEFV